MKKAKLSLAWQIVIGLVLGVAIGALLNHFSAEKAWWISNVLQPAGDIFIRLIKMIVVPIVISSLIVGIAGVGDAKKLGSIGLKTILYFEVVTTIAIVVGLVLANLFHPGGFFQGFAQGGLGQGLKGFEVAGRLVEDVLVGFELFDEEELAFVLDDGGDGDVGLPGHLRCPFRWPGPRCGPSPASQLPQVLCRS